MIVGHLMASAFFGGPERQMLGLALALPPAYKSVFLSFPGRGLCQPFLEALQRYGFEALALKEDNPRFVASVREITGLLRHFRPDILLCHGDKPDVLGLIAARRVGIPVVSVSRGWTAQTLKVRVNEVLDRLSLHYMDAVVCVSEGQAAKVRRLGIPANRVTVIRNAIRADRFASPDTDYRDILQGMFPERRSQIVGAAGRLSPEKGFANLVMAAEMVTRVDPSVGFVIFGEGRLREELTRQIAERRLTGKVLLPGFRDELDRYIPVLDLITLPSYTEGLPNILLESFAAGVPVVATAVGGTPEIIQDGVSGYLIPPGDPAALAERILDVLGSEYKRRSMGSKGREHIQTHFTFEAQAAQYQHFFDTFAAKARRHRIHHD